MSWGHPQLLALLVLLPPLLWWAWRDARRNGGPVSPERAQELGAVGEPGPRRARAWLLLAGLALLVVASARPQWGELEQEVEQEGIDLVVCLDISRSMLADDITPSRLLRARAELRGLIGQLRGDRVGLVFFAGAAFPQCPLTVDYGAAELFLSQADPSMISAQGTDIGSALRVALELFGEERGRHRAVLLVTDGEDFAGQVEPLASELADAGIVAFAVGLGSDAGAPIPLPEGGFVRDDAGNVVVSRLDEGPLRALASATGGEYFAAGGSGLGLARVQAALGGLEGRRFAARQVVRRAERYHWPLGLALLCLLLAASLPDRPRRGPAGALAVLLLLVASGLATPASAVDPLQRAARAAGAARSSLAAGDSLQALQQLLRAQRLAPDDPRVRMELGELLLGRGEAEAARRQFEAAGRLPGADPARTHYAEGNALLAAGDPQAALASYRRALLAGPAPGELRDDLLYNLELAQRLVEQGEPGEGEPQAGEEGGEGEDEETPPGEEGAQAPPDSSQGGEQPSPPDSTQGQQEPAPPDSAQGDPQEQEGPPEAPPDSLDAPPPAPADSSAVAAADSLGQAPQGMTPEQAMRLLQALGHDEEALLKALQRRLRGGNDRSGKEW